MLLEVFGGKVLTNLLQIKTEILIEALCDMIKNLICIFPRNKPIPIVFAMALTFLDSHLPDSHLTCFPSVLNVWYITLR
jgi:hypothetical protein